MGAMRKVAVYLGLVEDDLERYDDGTAEPADERYEAAARRTSTRPENVRVAGRVDPPTTSPAVREPSGSVRTAVRPRPDGDIDLRRSSGVDDLEDSYRITTLHPRSYNDARRLGEEFRLGVPVIMNLTEMNDIDAKRLIDFSAGLVFGLHGSIERVTNKVFLLSPANVDVGAHARRLAQDGFFNQS